MNICFDLLKASDLHDSAASPWAFATSVFLMGREKSRETAMVDD